MIQEKVIKMAVIKSCIIWTNGTVSSFNKEGEQIPEYQGFILDIADKLKTACDENTKWTFSGWNEWSQDADFGWHWAKEDHDSKG